MSSYDNFVKDFPKRCSDLLEDFYAPAAGKKREVTLLLAVATTGLAIPLERLRIPATGKPQHPTRDRERFEKAARKVDRLMQRPFLASELWACPVASWIFAAEVQDEQRELELWPEIREPKSLTSHKTVGAVLKHLRNALAHGNIYTHGTHGKRIDRLVFLSRPSEHKPQYAMLAVAPDDFHAFLRKWFSFLASIPMPTGIHEGAMVA